MLEPTGGPGARGHGGFPGSWVLLGNDFCKFFTLVCHFTESLRIWSRKEVAFDLGRDCPV